MGWEDSRLYHDWHRAVEKPPKNDFVILVTASSKTPVSGTGKSTLLATLAKRCDRTEEGFDATKKATLDAGELAYELAPNLESGSAVIFDEAQGTPGKQGLDGRRAMKSEVIDAINAILANRDKNFTMILGAQQFNTLDPRVPPLIDAWLLIRKSVKEYGGPAGTYHKVHTNDYDLNNPSPKTPAVEDFSWEPLPDDDPDYVELERLKQIAKRPKQKEGDKDNGKLSDVAQLKIAEKLRNVGYTWQEIADDEDLTYSREWFRQRVDEDLDVAKSKV